MLKKNKSTEKLNSLCLEDGITWDELGISDDDTYYDMIYEDDTTETIDENEIGFDNGFVSDCDMENFPETARLLKYYDVYFVVSDSDYPTFDEIATRSRIKAQEYLKSIPKGYSTVEEQWKAMKERCSDIDGVLYFDAKYNHWNIKYNGMMLIEYAYELNEDEIRREVKRMQEFQEKLQKDGIELINLYKKPREWNNNQRYYVFVLYLNNIVCEFEAHIPSKLEHRTRYPIDFFKDEWVSEMKKIKIEDCNNEQ